MEKKNKKNPFEGKKFVLVEKDGSNDEYAAKWGFLSVFLLRQLDYTRENWNKEIESGYDYPPSAGIYAGLLLANIAITVFNEKWDEGEEEIFKEIQRRVDAWGKE